MNAMASGVAMLGCHHQIALVLAGLVVDDDHETRRCAARARPRRRMSNPPLWEATGCRIPSFILRNQALAPLYPEPAGSQSSVGPVGSRRGAVRSAAPRGPGCRAGRSPRGSDAAPPSRALGWWGPGSADPVEIRWPPAPASTLTPGCTERRRRRPSGVEVHHGQVADHHTQIVVAARRMVGACRIRSWPTPLTTSTRSTNTRGRVLGDPVAGGVVDRVARARRELRAVAGSVGPSRRSRRCSGCRTGRAGWRPSSRAACRRRRCRTRVRNGIQPSTTAGGLPTAGISPSSSASPSESTRSGLEVRRASRAPIVGISPIGLAMISPSLAQASAHAATQTSARVTGVVRAMRFMGGCSRSRRGRRRRRPGRPVRPRPGSVAGSHAQSSGSLAACAYSFWKTSSRS